MEKPPRDGLRRCRRRCAINQGAVTVTTPVELLYAIVRPVIAFNV